MTGRGLDVYSCFVTRDNGIELKMFGRDKIIVRLL